MEQESRPNKKVYAITEAGREVCLRMLLNVSARHKLRSEFVFILSFAPCLPRRRIKTLLDERLTDLDQTHASLDAIVSKGSKLRGPATPGQAFCVGLGRALVEAERKFILENTDWLLRQAPEELRLAELATN